MHSKIKIHIPSMFAMFVILYLFWALWKEFRFSESLYNAGVLCFFVYIAATMFKKECPVYMGQAIFYMSAWCVFMFMAYNNSIYSTFRRTVNFLGILMDSHARVVLYLFLVVVPGILLARCYKYTSGRLFKIIVALIIVTSLYYSVHAVIVFPDALRARRTAAYLGYETILFGTPTYSIVYSFCLIAPWFLAKCSETRGKTKLFYFLMLACICAIVAISQFATAFVALIIGVFVYWLYSGKSDKGYILRYIVVLGIILMFFARRPLAELFDSLSMMVSGAWSGKLKDLADFIQGENISGSISTRLRLYNYSWQAFLQSPVLGKLSGIQTGNVGGHSTMLDILAMTGFLGAVLLGGAVRASFKHMKAVAQNEKYIAVATASFVSYLFLVCTKNILSSLSVNYTYFALLPMLFVMKEPGENEEVTKVSEDDEQLNEIKEEEENERDFI